MHMTSKRIFSNQGKQLLKEKSIDYSNFVSYKARISGEFDSRKDSEAAKLEREPQMLIKLSLKELCDLKRVDVTLTTHSLHGLEN